MKRAISSVFCTLLLTVGVHGPAGAAALPGERTFSSALKDGSVRSDYVAQRGHRGGAHPGAHAGRPAAVHRPAGGGAAVRHGGNVNVHRNANVHRNTNVNVHRNVVVRPPVRAWAHRPYYGRVVGGVALGTVITAAAIGAAPIAPAPNLCWYWSDARQTQGYWDYCQAP